MPSILPGYEYDIFISYRQKDNKYDGWVTEFITNLKKELEANFKEDISVYTDQDSRSGLLETHDVDLSLEQKLKCLIFIPIISRTYCDPKSFAWKDEFMAFKGMAQEDELGFTIKLPNGNYANRILPVQIHDLDPDDQQMLENELGHLRSIEFIYRSAGINRARTQRDDQAEKSNEYRNQVNKVVNAIRELISGIQKKETAPISNSHEQITANHKDNRKGLKYILAALVIILLCTAFYFLLPKMNFKSEATYAQSNGVEIKSIAVLPLVNRSRDADQEYFSDGISEELINALSKVENLKVAGRTSSFSYKNKNEDLKVIGQKLGVNTILEGSVRKSGSTVRITVQLINAQDGFNLWTATYDRELTDIFKVQDEITNSIMDELKLQLDPNMQNRLKTKETGSAAYDNFLRARQKLAARGDNLFEAQKLFEKVISQDPDYSPAYSGLARTLSLLPIWTFTTVDNIMKPAIEAAEQALVLDSLNAEAYSALGALFTYEWKWQKAQNNLEKSVRLKPNDAEIVNFLGDFYRWTWDPKVIETESKAMDLDRLYPNNFAEAGLACYIKGQEIKAMQLATEALQMDSTNANAVLLMTEN